MKIFNYFAGVFLALAILSLISIPIFFMVGVWTEKPQSVNWSETGGVAFLLVIVFVVLAFLCAIFAEDNATAVKVFKK